MGRTRGIESIGLGDSATHPLTRGWRRGLSPSRGRGVGWLDVSQALPKAPPPPPSPPSWGGGGGPNLRGPGGGDAPAPQRTTAPPHPGPLPQGRGGKTPRARWATPQAVKDYPRTP